MPLLVKDRKLLLANHKLTTDINCCCDGSDSDTLCACKDVLEFHVLLNGIAAGENARCPGCVDVNGLYILPGPLTPFTIPCGPCSSVITNIDTPCPDLDTNTVPNVVTVCISVSKLAGQYVLFVIVQNKFFNSNFPFDFPNISATFLRNFDKRPTCDWDALDVPLVYFNDGPYPSVANPNPDPHGPPTFCRMEDANCIVSTKKKP